ncbi:MAG: biotin--[acetyl-CoA-carboxylase] ligase [Candidatus Ratteibacteria bacterium]
MEKIKDFILLRFDKVSSTMDIAKKFISEYEKFIVIAKEQTHGRGRYGRKWLSPEGGLYLSFTLKKNEITDFLSEIISLSLIETFKKLGIKNCKIKFPNDIIINNKKISGILIEKSGDFYIVGVGINVKKKVEFENYITVEDILKKTIRPDDVLLEFIDNFEKVSELFKKNKEIGLKKWSEFLLK